MKKDLYQVLRHPINTEKSNILLQNNIYIFKILKEATKEDVKKAVELVFNVKVKEVKTLITKGKNKIFKGRKGKRADCKKALVKLEDGQQLDFSLGA